RALRHAHPAVAGAAVHAVRAAAAAALPGRTVRRQGGAHQGPRGQRRRLLVRDRGRLRTVRPAAFRAQRVHGRGGRSTGHHRPAPESDPRRGTGRRVRRRREDGCRVTAFREATIDLSAVTENVRHLRTLTGVQVIGVVKANGYGHGAAAVPTAALAGGATRLGTATLEESFALRRAGITAPLVAWLHAPGRRF